MSGLDFDDFELTLARTQARRAAYKWSHVDRSEVESELYLWLCSNYKWVVRYRTEQGGRGKLAVALRRAAHAYAAGEQLARVGGRKEDTQSYNREQVCVLLRRMFDPWPQETVDEHPVSHKPGEHHDSGDALAVLADVSQAFYSLTPTDREVLRLRFEHDMVYGDVGLTLSVNADAARKRVDRALDRMLVKLSGDVPWFMPQGKRNM